VTCGAVCFGASRVRETSDAFSRRCAQMVWEWGQQGASSPSSDYLKQACHAAHWKIVTALPRRATTANQNVTRHVGLSDRCQTYVMWNIARLDDRRGRGKIMLRRIAGDGCVDIADGLQHALGRAATARAVLDSRQRFVDCKKAVHDNVVHALLERVRVLGRRM